MRSQARYLCFSLTLTQALALAQPTVAPTPETVGRARGEEVNNYNIVHSFETGYRFHSVGGNLGKYRSDVNFGNGVRLLSSNLSVHSKEGHGGLFDEILLNTLGLGNDPYQYATVRLQKNRMYRYNMLWRLNDYFNPALPIAAGQHFRNTERRMQDHDLTLLPQSKVRLHLGYTRNVQDGPALSTVQLFDVRGDEFPFFADLRRQQNEFRLGGDIDLLGFKFTWMRGWENFKEDTDYRLLSPSPGNNLTDQTALTSFRRNEPYHGNTPSWRFGLLTERGRWLAVNGRYTYAGGQRNFVLDETSVGADRFGGARNRQVLVFGSGRRPVSAGHLTISLFPSDRLTVTSHTSFHHTRMEGDGLFLEFNNATARPDLLQFQFLGIRNIATLTDLNYRATKWIGFYGGYHYSTRRIRSREQFTFLDLTEATPAEQENRLHSGLAGIRLQPVKPLRITLDAEIGRADRPFYPISEKNYHALGARAQYKAGSLLLSAAARSNYNTNSVSLSSHSPRARNFAFDASWTPKPWFAFDLGYSKLHLDTATGIAYFAAAALIEGERSLYVSNIHAVNAGLRFGLGRRADLFVGYSRSEDTGDGRRLIAEPPGGQPRGSALAAFRAAQTFPLTFDSPQARLSVRLHGKLRWNVGYQHYRYAEEFLVFQDYRAHTGFSSLLWSF